MNYKTIQTSVEGNALIVTINHPPANALNDQVLTDLKDIFENYVPFLDEIGGVIITGMGRKFFVAGADIKEFLALNDTTGRALAQRGHDIFNLIESFPKPVIAAVNGYALGGGCELAMACHMRIAATNARFGQPEVNLGIIPGYGGTQRLTQLVGKGKAMELILTGDMISAEEAKTLGLVNHVTDQETLMSKARGIINKIAQKAPLAVTGAIKAINACFEQDGFQVEVEEFGKCAATQDFKEGATAFLEKRKPAFRGI